MYIVVHKAYCPDCEGVWYELDREDFKQCQLCGKEGGQYLGMDCQFKVEVDKYTGEVELVTLNR